MAKSLKITHWRRGWDSNPRGAIKPPSDFESVPVWPLRYLSGKVSNHNYNRPEKKLTGVQRQRIITAVHKNALYIKFNTPAVH